MKLRQPYCLARTYIDLTDQEKPLVSIVDLLQSATSASAVTAELNFGAQRPIDATKARLEKLATHDVEQILAIDEDGELTFAIGKELREGSNCFSLVTCWPASAAYGAPQNLLTELTNALPVAYGYAWVAPPDVSPISEAPLRKRWFGHSVRVPRHREGWLSPIQSVLTGGIRGIYPLNYWSPAVHVQLQSLGVRLPPRLAGSNGLVAVDADTARAIRSLNPGKLEWLHSEA